MNVPVLQPVAIAGLDIHLEYLIEFVKQIDEGRTQIGSQGIKEAGDGDLHGFGFGAIDVQIELGAVGAKSCRQAVQVLPRIAGIDKFGDGLLEPRRTQTRAVFHHHRKSGAGSTQRFAHPGDRQTRD